MKHINVVMLAFLDPDGLILLNRRNDSAVELWGLLGGGIEANEKPLAALQREILEEVNYKLDERTDHVEFVKSIHTTFSKYIADVHFFKARFPGLEHFSGSDEVGIEDLRLVPISQALELPLLPLARYILETERTALG